MNHTRPAAVAGTFYSDAPLTLRRDVTNLLGGAHDLGVRPKAIVVPHAGYVYSGSIAAQAYAQVRGHAGGIRRVVLIGPSHRVAFRGLAVPTSETFATPLGEVPIDKVACVALAAHPEVIVSDRAHALEHSLEVQLPFLQSVLTEFSLVPLVAGDAPPDMVAEVLETVWGGSETLIVVSTDLSHFHDYRTAQSRDADSARRILDMRPGLRGDDACGCVGLNGFLMAAGRHCLAPRQLCLCNSGDTAGDRTRVVGYGAFAFYDADTPIH